MSKENDIAPNQPQEVKLLVNELVQVSVDRTMKDVRGLINSLINAESIYYPNRTRLYDFYKTFDLDGFLQGIIEKRLDAVLNKKLLLLGKDKKEVDGVDTILESEAFREMCKQILLTKFWGVTGMEFIPGLELAFEEIPRKHIKPEIGVIANNQSEYSGTAYTGISNIWVIGKKHDYGILLRCAFPALIKKNDFGDWAQYVEIFGQPVRVGKYDANDDKTRVELRKALIDAGGSLAIMIPKQAEFEVLDGKISNGDGQLQERLKNACNDEMAIAILGNVETTSSNNGGSNAKAKEHGKQQMEITKSDMAYLLSQLNSAKCKEILLQYRFPVADAHFTFEKEVDLAALSQKIVIDTSIKTAGVPIADDYFYETYGIPKPDNYDELKAKQEDEKQPPQPIENEPPSKEPTTKQKAKKQAKKAQQENLSAWQKLMAKMADFFDPAHKD